MPTVVIITFVLVLAIVFGAYWLFVGREESVEQQALRKRFKRAGMVAPAPGAGGSLIRADRPLSSIGWLDRLLRAGRNLVSPAEDLVRRTGLEMTVGSFLLLSAVIGIAVFAGMWHLSGSALLALTLAGLSALAPTFALRLMANRRVARFEEQFPEAIDLLSRSLRAGHALPAALSMVAEELPDPVGTEFKLAHDRQNFGMPLPDALRSLGERVPLIDARFFVTAVLTQRDVGGNLAAVLENLAAVIRERFRVKRQVRVITAHSRMTAWVLALMPPTLALILTMVARDSMSLLWTHPTGIKMVAVAVLLQVTGTLIISRLANVEY